MHDPLALHVEGGVYTPALHVSGAHCVPIG
jgi:hypothetical protein